MNPLILKKGREKSLLRRHPWIFSGAVDKASGKAGETLEVRSASGKPDYRWAKSVAIGGA